MKVLRLNIRTEQDYFDALEVLYQNMDQNQQAYLLFKVLVKACRKFEARKRIELWQHLQWSN